MVAPVIALKTVGLLTVEYLMLSTLMFTRLELAHSVYRLILLML